MLLRLLYILEVDMIQFINDMLTVIGKYVSFLFSLQFLQGVSVGSLLLISLLFYAIVKVFWARDKEV